MSIAYFAYGGNTHPDQIATRCPGYKFKGVGRLPGYRWIICERGYPNVVQGCEQTASTSAVWGLVFELPLDNIDSLDHCEGVPFLYQRQELGVDYWPVGETTGYSNADKEQPHPLNVLIYIDMRSTTPGLISAGYVFRMTNGLRESILRGVPQEFVMNEQLPQVLLGKQYVADRWDEYRNRKGELVGDAPPEKSTSQEVEDWLHNILDKIGELSEQCVSPESPVIASPSVSTLSGDAEGLGQSGEKLGSETADEDEDAIGTDDSS
jgi:gamma-glutamylcyclotransferase